MRRFALLYDIGTRRIITNTNGRTDRVRTLLDDLRADNPGGYPGAVVVRIPKRFKYDRYQNSLVVSRCPWTYPEMWDLSLPAAEGRGNF